MDLNIVPFSGKTYASMGISEVVKLIDESRMPYRLTPSDTCMKGDNQKLTNNIASVEGQDRPRGKALRRGRPRVKVRRT